MKKYITAFVLPFVTFACYVNENQAQVNHSLNPKFGDYWYQGKAELASYDLNQSRYGEIRNGHAVLIFLTEDFSNYRRYNAAVMKVGDLSPEDLIDLQNEAFASIYLAPWRWEPMIKKFGIEGAMTTVKRLMKCIDKDQNRFLTDKSLGLE